MGRNDSELRQVGCRDFARRGRNTDDPLSAGSLEDILGSGRPRRLNTRENLRDRTNSVDLRERVYNVVDLVIDLRIENPVSSANHRLSLADRIPTEPEARADVVPVGADGIAAIVHFVAQADIEREIGSHAEGILDENGIVRIDGGDARIAEALLVGGGQSQIKRLQ